MTPKTTTTPPGYMGGVLCIGKRYSEERSCTMAVITISRQFGSGGDEIAVRVCDVLGYRYFDKRLMTQVASEIGLSENDVVDFSEDDYKVQSFLDRLLSRRQINRSAGQAEPLRARAAGREVEEVEKMDEAHTVTLVQSTIDAAYRHGNVVIVGRGGQAILKDKPEVLHVRIQASLDTRVQRLHQRANYSLGGAQDAALKHDRASAEYLKRFYDIDWTDPMLYDLVINAGKLDIEAAAQLIVSAVNKLTAAKDSN
jgi:cytidylate kinase